jgi:hypothetical protein
MSNKKELYEKVIALGQELIKYDSTATFIFAASVDSLDGVVLASNAGMDNIPEMLEDLIEQVQGGEYEARGSAPSVVRPPNEDMN